MGTNNSDTTPANFSYVHATGNIKYAVGTTGKVDIVGGLIGTLGGSSTSSIPYGSSLSYAYATGNVFSPDDILLGSIRGGLVGTLGGYASISKSYALGNVYGNGNSSLGGLVGQVSATTSVEGVQIKHPVYITDSYAAGEVISLDGSAGAAGIVGYVGGELIVSNVYWNENTTENWYSSDYVDGSYSYGTVTGTPVGLTRDQLRDGEISTAILQGRDPQTILTARAEAAAQAAAEAAYRQETIAAVVSIADDQQASIAQLAATAGQVLSALELTPIDLSNAIRDFTPSQTGGSDKSYSASVREVTVDGVTFLVDDDEENRTAR
jgi:hypothetical protein